MQSIEAGAKRACTANARHREYPRTDAVVSWQSSSLFVVLPDCDPATKKNLCRDHNVLSLLRLGIPC